MSNFLRSRSALSVVPFFLTLLSRSASAADIFKGTAQGNTTFAGSLNGEANTPSYDLTKKIGDTHGGDGGATSRQNFAGGTWGISTHGCAGPDLTGPTVSYREGGGPGTAMSSTNAEQLIVKSDTLAVSTPVHLTFCFNIAVQMDSEFRQPNQVLALNDLTSFQFKIGTQVSKIGALNMTGTSQTIQGTGVFDNSKKNQSFFETYDVIYTVGAAIRVTMTMKSTSVGSAYSFKSGQDISFGFASASAGVGATLGLDSITDGAYLFSDSLQTKWTGQCGGATGIIPPNPVHPSPEPGSWLALGVGSLWFVRRRRSARP